MVGSGPNGLAAAVTLARAGLDVEVLEAEPTAGGGTRSSPLTVPGLIHDDCAGFHPLAVDSPFFRATDLKSHGLDWWWPAVQYAHPLEGGTGAAVLRSVDDTAAGLGTDASAYRSIIGTVSDRFEAISSDFFQPMLRLPHHPVAMGRFGLRAAVPASVLAKVWRTPEGRALFAGVAAHAMRDFSTPMSSAIGVALAAAAHTYGWPVAAGGSKSISDAMIAALKHHGGRVTTGFRVDSLAQLGDPDVVMLDVAPRAAVSLIGERMPSRIRRALLAYRHGPGAFKVDFAVDGAVPWVYEPASRAGTVHLGGSYAQIAAAERSVARGRMPQRPFVLVGQQYVADPSRSSERLRPLYSYAHVPAGYTGDATAVIEDTIERYAPGFRDRIVAKHVRSTHDIATSNANYIGGDIVTGANSARQLIFRPRASLDPYYLGVPGMYLCSAATPPGAGAHGMCGYNAARRALQRLR